MLEYMCQHCSRKRCWGLLNRKIVNSISTSCRHVARSLAYSQLLSARVCAGVESLGGKYELHDLVQLDAHTAGVIVGIDKDTARVLTNQSTLKTNDIRLCRVRTVW